jgi:hypothetical protein
MSGSFRRGSSGECSHGPWRSNYHRGDRQRKGYREIPLRSDIRVCQDFLAAISATEESALASAGKYYRNRSKVVFPFLTDGNLVDTANEAEN